MAILPALLNAGIIFYILFYLPKNRLTDLFTCFVLALTLWQAEDIIVRLTASVETAHFWDRVCCIGWVAIAPLAFHFACKLASLKELTTRFALFILYGPFVVFYTLYVTNPDPTNFISHKTWGWLNVTRPGTFDQMQRYWIALVVLATAFILAQYAWANRKHHDNKFRQARMIAIGIMIPALQVVITQFVFPILHIRETTLTSTFMSVFSVSTLIAIARYKFFHVAESVASDSLMENIEKFILIVSPEKKIIYINHHASNTFGIDQEDLESADFKKIFCDGENYFERYSTEVFETVINGAQINNYSSILVTSVNTKIDVLITSSLVVNNNIVEGVLMVANDITELVNVVQELDDERRLKEKAITSAVITTQEKERMTLGSELHDNINQILASSLLYLNLVKTEKENIDQYVNETEGLIYHAIDEIRKLSHTLIAPKLNETELTEALNKIFSIAGKTGILKIQKVVDIDENSIPEQLKLNIYRIVQEQFNNILKYARAETIHITLIQNGKKLLLSIKDDGIGFDTQTRSGGVGLSNMRSRAALFNGELTIISSPGNGCELNVVFENFEVCILKPAQKNGAGDHTVQTDLPTYNFQLRTA